MENWWSHAKYQHPVTLLLLELDKQIKLLAIEKIWKSMPSDWFRQLGNILVIMLFMKYIIKDDDDTESHPEYDTGTDTNASNKSFNSMKAVR